MKLNFNQPLVTFDGRPVAAPAPTATDEKAVKVATLGFICVESLLVPVQGAPPLTGTQTIQRYALAKRIYVAQEPIDVTAEEISELKALLPKCWPSPLVSGQCALMLEGAA